jgi:hypothetical protein
MAGKLWQALDAGLGWPQARDGERPARLRRYEDLVSGRILPDDLLPSATAWVWDGETYQPGK